MPSHLNLVVIRARNPMRSARFYRALGLELSLEQHGSGPEHFACSEGGRTFEIYPLRARADSTTGVRLGFVVDGLDALLNALEDAGGRRVSAPSESEDGVRAVVRDPDGHTIELLEPKQA